MAVKIRLRRTGRKKQPSYRLVVADTDTPRDGQYLDAVGTYNPLTRPADLRIDLDKVDEWLARGAGMTDTVASLIRKARQGGDRKVAVRGVGPDEPAAPPVVEARPAEKPKAGSRGAPKAAAAEPPADDVAEARQPASRPRPRQPRRRQPRLRTWSPRPRRTTWPRRRQPRRRTWSRRRRQPTRARSRRPAPRSSP
jgi:small subunit ribosomal protein S16